MRRYIKTASIILLSLTLMACSADKQVEEVKQDLEQVQETVEEIVEDNIQQDSIVIDTNEEKLSLEAMNYWIVFYNPDGSELQRTAEKYGSIPKYNGETPVYWDSEYWYRFICWTDKNGEEIKEFAPITGNKYIYAKYEIGGPNKPKEESEPIYTPVVDSVTVTLSAAGEHDEGFDPDVSSVKCPKGSSYSISGITITINGTTYTLVYPGNLVSFDYWSKDGEAAPASGTIDGDTEFTAHFGPV